MKSPFTERFVNATAKRFSLDAAALGEALGEAWEVYEDEVSLDEYRMPFSAQIEDISPMLRAVRNAQAKWEKLEPDTRGYLSQFIGGGETADEFVGRRLVDISVLLVEFKEQYGNLRGNPGKAHSAPTVNLQPFHCFTDVLRDFWCAHTGRPFGHVLENRYEREEADPNRGDLVPKSDALAFLLECARQVSPGITPKACRTLVRKSRRRAG